MRTALRWLAISSLVLWLAAAMAARTRPRYGGTLRMEVRNVDWRDNDAVRPLVLECLTRIGSEGEAQPLLATHWEAQNGARRWLFTLRSKVQWHDGAPLTAASAAASLQAAVTGTELDGSTVRAEGGTVVVEAARPLPNLPAELALGRFALARNEQGQVLGTGAFRVDRTMGNRVALAANDAYWGGRPYLDNIEIVMGRSVRDQWMDAGVNRTDIAAVPAEMLRRAQQDGLRPISSHDAELIALVAKHSGKALDMRLRQALAATVDRLALLNFALQKQGEIAPSLLPNWLTGYAVLFAAEPDPARAHELRGEAGQSRALAIGYEAGDGTLQLMAERIALNARDNGVQAMAVGSGDPDFVVRRIPLPSGNAQIALTELANAVQTPIMLSSEDSDELFRSERDLLTQSNLIPLLYVPRAYAVAERVNGANLDATGRLELTGAWNEENR
jgi:MarR-like DNA-binding transcriptional regulator SgrR of sgrS sRNA